MRPGLRPRHWPRPPPPPGPPGSPSPLRPDPAVRAAVPGPGPEPWSGAGPWGSGWCCCSAPRCPRGRAPRKVPTPALAPPPSRPRPRAPTPSRGQASTPLQKPAFLRRPCSPRPSPALSLCPTAGLSTGQAHLWSLTPSGYFPGSVTPTPAGQQSAPGSEEGVPDPCQEAAPAPAPLPAFPDSPSFRRPPQRSEPLEVEGGKSPPANLGQGQRDPPPGEGLGLTPQGFPVVRVEYSM